MWSPSRIVWLTVSRLAGQQGSPSEPPKAVQTGKARTPHAGDNPAVFSSARVEPAISDNLNMLGTKTAVSKDVRLDQAYSIMQSMENKLGGGEGVEGIYGSITRVGMQRIFDSMQRNCGFGSNSILLDVGAGLGRPLIHALLSPGIRAAHGIELDHVKVHKAESFIDGTLAELVKRGHAAPQGSKPVILCKSVEQVTTFGSATHAYSFWEGIPVSGRQAFGHLFASSPHMKCVTVVQRCIRGQHPTQLMESYGFGPLLLIANFTVSMSGSGASFQAYIFSKVATASANLLTALRSPPPAAVAAPATGRAVRSAAEEQHADMEVVAAVARHSQEEPGAGSMAAAARQTQQIQEEEQHMVDDAPQAAPAQGVSARRPRAKKQAAQAVGGNPSRQQAITGFGKEVKPSIALKSVIQKDASGSGAGSLKSPRSRGASLVAPLEVEEALAAVAKVQTVPGGAKVQAGRKTAATAGDDGAIVATRRMSARLSSKAGRS